MITNSMFKTLVNLKGNARASIFTEPLWNIPYNLYIPYATIYMRALGVTQVQIGLVITIFMIFQVIFSLLGGVITDKIGRKKTTFIFDCLSWGIPTFLWAISDNIYYFVIAAAINGMYRVTAISWTCLFVEDAKESQLLSLFSWIHITGMITAFVAPLTGLFINRFDLIPTIRGIYIFAFISMMAKFIILNIYAKETEVGKIRMEETKNESWLSMLKGYARTIRHIMDTSQTIYVVGIMVIMSIVSTINTNFWGILVTERLGVDASYIGLLAGIKSMCMILFYFFVLPKIHVNRFRKPLLIGLVTFIFGQVAIITVGGYGFLFIIVSLLLEGISLSLINPLLDSLQVTLIDKAERARIVAVLYTVVILMTAPFGSLAGLLSSIDQRLPFVLNIVLVVVGIVITLVYGNKHQGKVTEIKEI